MFVSEEKLVHLLKPHHYNDEDFYQKERECLFDPAWHFVGLMREIPNHGDFLTKTLFDVPLLVRNHEGTAHVYLNVCGHRHSQLTSKEKGTLPNIKCQYHGWEYKVDGSTGKIPEAKCFKPFDRENTHLKCFRTVQCGQLIFVALTDDAPDFDTFLGTDEPVREWFSGDQYRFGSRLIFESEANWKIPAENTLESYHIECVHPKTIKEHPKEKDQEHLFSKNSSTLITYEPPSLSRSIQDRFIPLLNGSKPTHKYTHLYIYPNLVFIKMDSMTMVQSFVPLSPTRFRWDGVIFSRASSHWSRKWLEQTFKPVVVEVAKAIVREDSGVYPEVQKGLRSSCHPGVIGTIEERLFAFQEHVLASCEELTETESQHWY